jgi:hypothetical protein
MLVGLLQAGAAAFRGAHDYHAHEWAAHEWAAHDLGVPDAAVLDGGVPLDGRLKVFGSRGALAVSVPGAVLHLDVVGVQMPEGTRGEATPQDAAPWGRLRALLLAERAAVVNSCLFLAVNGARRLAACLRENEGSA